LAIHNASDIEPKAIYNVEQSLLEKKILNHTDAVDPKLYKSTLELTDYKIFLLDPPELRNKIRSEIKPDFLLSVRIMIQVPQKLIMVV